ncbi:hypothetical protein PR202_gb17226 [Eleusine coracana subsp. coracana]|uniref:Importin N-terminal domain-containing protein n=1 Tax=Eleusine coracana subsp. coracana TaxID=191504 RepID=A0AAV5F2I3_ELECO|nr:hypothetical protein PR202_gb17226 [Eleusine coracana subsp. coracana]
MAVAGGAADGDQRWLVDCLTATLDTSRDVRAFAEESLRQASLLPGYGAGLTKLLFPSCCSFTTCYLAAVLLKQFIKHHWQEDEENFVPPVVSSSEKVVIRQLLLTSLDDSHGKIRTAISMAVAAIGQQDWPEDWPELLPLLLKFIGDQSNGNGVRGALRCLALLSDDLDDTCVPKLVPELFPSLHRIISSPDLYENSLRAKALAIVHSCISMLGSMSGVYKRDTVSLMTSMLDPLVEQFSIILNSPVQSQNPDDWSMHMELFLHLFGQTFTFIVQDLSPVIHSRFQRIYSLDYDSDGSEKVLSPSRFRLLQGNKELAIYTIGFQQITAEQVQSWSRDANQYVADEDDATYSCRVSGSLLLEEIVTAYEDYGIDSILEAAQMRFCESRELKQAGSADWWRLYEASLFALGSLSEQLCEAQISKGISEQYLSNAARVIASDVPPPVKVGACRALAQLLPGSNEDLIQPNIMGILSSLVDLLRQASDETLHLVLETLQSAIKSGGEQSTSIEPIISPIVLDVWVQHIADPFISIDAVEVLENAPPIVVKAVFDTCFISTILIVLKSDDHGEMQNATECLAAFISGGRQELLAWGGEQGSTLKMLLDAVSRLLDPVLESSVSLFVGSFVLQLILHVHLSSPNVDQFINLLLSIPAQGYGNSLVYIMSEWSQLQGEIQGSYQIKVTTTALALLISTRHPELSKFEVQGHLIKTSAGVTTRSKARVAPDQWTKIPLPVKIFSLLADTLAEIQEQIGGDDDDCDEDSDWEEVQNGDTSNPDDIMYSASVPSNANPSIEHLNAMAKVFDEDDDGSYDDDLTKTDPLNEVFPYYHNLSFKLGLGVEYEHLQQMLGAEGYVGIHAWFLGHDSESRALLKGTDALMDVLPAGSFVMQVQKLNRGHLAPSEQELLDCGTPGPGQPRLTAGWVSMRWITCNNKLCDGVGLPLREQAGHAEGQQGGNNAAVCHGTALGHHGIYKPWDQFYNHLTAT